MMMKTMCRRRWASLLLPVLTAIALAGCSNDNGTTQPVTEFAPPTNLTYTNGVNEVVLNWTASTDRDLTDFAGYAVYRDTTSMAGYSDQKLQTVRLNQTPTTLTSYTDSGPVNGRRYYYAVRSVKDNGDISAASNQIDTSPRPEFSNITLAEYQDPGPSGLNVSEGTAVPMRDEFADSIDVYLGTNSNSDAADQPLMLKSPSRVHGGGQAPWNTRIAGLKLLGTGQDAWDAGTTTNDSWDTQVTLGATANDAVGKVIAVRTPGSGNQVHYAKIRIIGVGPVGPDNTRSLVVRVAYQQIPNYIRFRR